MLSEKAIALIESEDVLISPMVLVEVEFLHEIKRIKAGSGKILRDLQNEIGLKLCETSFAKVVVAAAAEKWTRDPFDRILVAQAKLNESRLITKDRGIGDNYRMAVW